eukprot:scaffold413281_cov23-Prasinocladus_malaysianus.AAC.1
MSRRRRHSKVDASGPRRLVHFDCWRRPPMSDELVSAGRRCGQSMNAQTRMSPTEPSSASI